MKTLKLTVLFLLIAFCLSTQAQVAINKDGSTPSVSSILHIKGDNALQAMFIESSSGNVGIGTINPETNLNIYSNADTNGLTFQTSDNTFMQGIRFRNSGGAYTWHVYRKNAGSNHADLIFANGFSTDLSTLTEVVTFKDGGSVGIGTSSPHATAALEVSSTTTGFLPPRLTQSQIEGILNPATGLMVFNTDDERIYFYSDASASWLELALGTGTVLPPCGADFIDSRDNQRYTTVLIGTQCWMSENLNYETSNSMCYGNNSTNCETYGRLYRGDVAETACPSGWHLPTDDEWKILEGNADTQYGVGDPVWDNTGYRGYNAGKRLKTTTGWNSNTGTDAVGFSALPGGYYNYSVSQFGGKGLNGQWWTASPGTNNAYYRFIYKSYNNISRNSTIKVYFAKSVRCVRD